MQQTAARRTDVTPPAPPAPVHQYLRTRLSVVKEAEALESADELARAFRGGWRCPWALPPCIQAWEASVSVRAFLAFLGALLEGSVRPRRVKGGLIAIDSVTRTVIGSIEEREYMPDTGCKSGKLIAGAWAELLGLSAKHARRVIHLAVELELVEQVRNRRPSRGLKSEASAAYRPTRKLLDWLLERRPPADLAVPETEKMSDLQKSSPLLRGEEDSDVSDLPKAGHRAPDELAELVGERPPELALGTVGGASAAAPVGDGRAAEGSQLLIAGVSARPAAPPAEEPPGEAMTREELRDAAARYLAERQEVLPRVSLAPPVSDIERRQQINAQLASLKRRAELEKQREPDPPTDNGAGGGA